MAPITRLKSGALKRKYTGANSAPSSRWDPTITKKVDVDALDLDHSYQAEWLEKMVEMEKEAREKWESKKPAKTTWKNPNRNKQPMNDPYRLPKGWTDVEPDLAEDDLEGHIKRCKERIAEGIMPYIFEQRLEHLEEVKKASLDVRAGEIEDLSFAVVLRLKTLEEMLAYYEREGDVHKQVANIKAVMNKYRFGGLELTGLVTYWSKGKQLCMPRPFDWDEFEAINKKCDSEGFWVEGLDGPEPQGIYAHLTPRSSTSNPNSNTYNMLFRLPNSELLTELEVLHDTGASVTAIFQSDLRNFAFREGLALPIMGAVCVHTHVGHDVYPVVDLHATVLSKERKRMTEWCRIRVAIMPGQQQAGRPIKRVDGPWVRHMMYMASAPDNRRRLYMATSFLELAVPKAARVSKAVPPDPASLPMTHIGMTHLPLGQPLENIGANLRPMPPPAWNLEG